MFKNKILQRYLVREWLRTFVPSLACFEFLIFLGFAIQLLHKGLDIIALRAIVPHLFVQAFPYSIPAALLTATAMNYGRMSADHEIIAVQASGIHILKIIVPVIVMGCMCSIVAVVLAAEVLPRSSFKMIQLQERAINSILAGRLANFQKKIDLHPYQIYIGSVEDGVNKDIAVIKYVDDYVTDVILAEEGAIKIDEEDDKIFLTMYRGEFIKPNYSSAGDVPSLGVFKETTFEISLKEKKRESSTRYMTILQLLRQNTGINTELKGMEKTLPNNKKNKEELSKELTAYQQELNVLSKKHKKLTLELKRSNESVVRQKAKIEGLENESKIAKNYILVANENLVQAKKEMKDDDSKEEAAKRIMKIKESIEREKQRIYAIEKDIMTARQIREDEMEKIESYSQTLSEINQQRDELSKTLGAHENDLAIAAKEYLMRKNDISIHKRLSQALSCITFVIIGVPLGIMLRSGHLMVGIGASFLVILFVYYPLVVTGIVLAEDLAFPVMPVIWGANSILFIGGAYLFRRLLLK
jgi:lipopolysaccharide export LptBFGC system permease protein LptF